MEKKYSVRKSSILKKTLKKQSCSPENKSNSFTCFKNSSLKKIINYWNRDNQGNKIIISDKKKYNNGDLWNKIDSKLKSKCNAEWCWVEQDFVKKHNDKDLSTTFRPKMPKDWLKHNTKWLTTTNIESVMKQYEKKYNDFYFIGTVPIDFDYEYDVGQCIVNELCKINIENLYNINKRKIGVVFNLDAHDEPGSHWVALYSDFNLGEVYYYDSYGIMPPDEVRVLMNRISSQGKNITTKYSKAGEPFKMYYNDIRHQFKNSECGVYSMHFISECLSGKHFKDVINNRVLDDDMNKKRNIFYRSETKI